MAADSDTQYAPVNVPDTGGIPAPRLRAGRQHVLETAFGLLSSSPTITYLMSFIVRMRYCPDTDSCQVVIQPHYSPADEHDEEIRNEIISPISQEIRAILGKKISRRTCGYISASSSTDEDNLADLFILYFFFSHEEGRGVPGASISGMYQMNMALRTFAPEMEEIAVNALERCLSVICEDSGTV
ncbi:MAG: hypothetical protein LUQ32_10305 [Methanomicrobiales archaeon]|nr:hypothetical protein [Methanomicrobiales archaeon]